jgi:hypothetical protein
MRFVHILVPHLTSDSRLEMTHVCHVISQKCLNAPMTLINTAFFSFASILAEPLVLSSTVKCSVP